MFARGVNRGHHVESALVVTDSGSIDAALFVHVLNPDLRLSGETGANLLPVDQVLAVEHGHARIVLEGAVHQIEIITSSTHGGVGMKAGKYRITESSTPSAKCHQHQSAHQNQLLHIHMLCFREIRCKDSDYYGINATYLKLNGL